MSEPVKISLCVITLNEGDNLEDCLESASWADELLVVDSGSTDETLEIAKRFACRVIHQDFLGHVRQKELAVREAEYRWVLCLDADERLEEGAEKEIREILARDACPERSDTEKSGTDRSGFGESGFGKSGSGKSETAESGSYGKSGYYFPRHTFYLGGWINHGGWWPEYRLRLFDREAGGWTGTDPHDRVEVSGETARLKSEIIHFNYRDLSHHMEKVNAYTTIMADRRFKAGRPASLFKMVFNPIGRFLRMFILKRGFLDGWRGFIIAVIGAYYVFLKYAKLWEMHRDRR